MGIVTVPSPLGSGVVTSLPHTPAPKKFTDLESIDARAQGAAMMAGYHLIHGEPGWVIARASWSIGSLNFGMGWGQTERLPFLDRRMNRLFSNASLGRGIKAFFSQIAEAVCPKSVHTRNQSVTV